MEYQVWTKEQYQEGYARVDCGDLDAARRELDKAVRAGGDPLLTVAVPYKLDIKVSEVGTELPKPPKPKKEPEEKKEEAAKSEADQGKPEPGEDTRAES